VGIPQVSSVRVGLAALPLLLHGLCVGNVSILYSQNKFVILVFAYPTLLSSPVPVAARSKAWVWGRSLAGVACSDPTVRGDGCLSVVIIVCCQAEVSVTG
jgi:hypothetical protein